MSEQQAILLQIRTLIAQLPPPLRKRYTPKAYTPHKDIYIRILDAIDQRPHTTRQLTDLMAHQYGVPISSGVIKYHIDKAIRRGEAYATMPTANGRRQYELTRIMQVRLCRNQPLEIYREYKNKADKRFFQRLDQFGQTQWVTAAPNHTWEIVPGKIRFAIEP
jgi:hypothetical protein